MDDRSAGKWILLTTAAAELAIALACLLMGGDAQGAVHAVMKLVVMQ